MTTLHLTISQADSTTISPFVFPMTGIRVYSLEEVLYHCFHEWRRSVDVLDKPDALISWIEGELGLGKIAAHLREFALIEDSSRRFLAFLGVTAYLPKSSINALAGDLAKWERRKSWEKLAEQGDYWSARGEGRRAYGLYTKSLALMDTPSLALLNNCGVAAMSLENYEEAIAYFMRALRLEAENPQLRFNLIEALIFAGDIDAAQSHIEEIAVATPEHHELYYFQGEVLLRQKSYFDAIRLFEKALDKHYDPEYIYKLCDCYMHIRLYDKALAAIATVREQDVTFLRKQASLYAAANNVPMAVKSIEKAIVFGTDNSDAELWTLLAEYHRLDYDLQKAAAAIGRALGIAPDNTAALLEQARIRKAQGRTKDYQSILQRILTTMKNDYRETAKEDVK